MPTPSKISEPQILARAIAILNAEGLEALSMRELARRLDVKAPSLYRYFPDKISIEKAAVEAGNKSLLAALQSSTESISGPAAALIAASEAYRKFALENPNLYALMMEKRLVFPPVSPSGKDLWNYVLSLVRAALGSADETSKAVALWSFLHGFVALEHSGRFGPSGARNGFRQGLHAIVSGLAGS